jgi:hypothetical protein
MKINNKSRRDHEVLCTAYRKNYKYGEIVEMPAPPNPLHDWDGIFMTMVMVTSSISIMLLCAAGFYAIVFK